ncbi:MAG TPA: ATP-binding protein [Terriglobales bacterium]|nr:ATP-binding protein [Terriglobales bacterium]
MNWFRTIRARLLFWYFASIVLLLGVLWTGSWYATKLSMYRAIDKSLSYNIEGVIELLNRYSTLDRATLAVRLREGAGIMAGGGVFRVYDSQRRLVYESPALARHKVEVDPPPRAESQVVIRNLGRSWKLRAAAEKVNLGGQEWVVEVAEPVVVYESAVREYEGILWMFVPLLAILAGLIGSYISRRALAPVDRIITSARTITASNLSDRLSVPSTGDELHRLTETLNGMLDRIESAFNRNRQFTADASHELRTPLTLIQSAAEYALRRDRDRGELQNALRQILGEAKRTVQMLNHLLTLARSDADVKIFEPGVVDLKSVVEELRPDLKALAAIKSQHINFRLPSEPIAIDGDANSLERLVLILVDNAVKYTPPEGSITVGLDEQDGAAVLTVRDTGVGISQEDVAHIFERFWRVDKARSREFGGAGLGLSLARSIADQHNASIAVESTPHHGSTFSVRFTLHHEAMQLTA